MKDFLVTDYGALACDSYQTEKLQSCIDACFLSGGGRVIVPKGIFLTGGLRLRSNVTLFLKSGAILRGSGNPKDYSAYLEDKIEPIDVYEFENTYNPYGKWHNGLIKVVNAENVSIIGEEGSFIDGVNCYDETGEEKYRGPHAISIYNAKNLYFEGYTIMNSANWAHYICRAENITARRLTVWGGHDGFDFFKSRNVTVEDCEFRTGDDCIAGYDNKDVIIRNCIFDCACSALRFGGTDVVVEECRGIAPSRYGFRGSLTPEEKKNSMPTSEANLHTMRTPFQYYCDFRFKEPMYYKPSNIVIRNCVFTNPDAIFLHPFDGKHIWCSNVGLASLTYENCEITGLSVVGVLAADEANPLDFRLKNVRITAKEGFSDMPILKASNCKYIEFDSVTVEGFVNPHILSDRSDNVTVKNGAPIEIKPL